MVDLKDITKNYKIFVDTSSLMHIGATNFFNDLSTSLRNNPLIIPFNVLIELKGLSKGGKTKEAALQRLLIIRVNGLVYV